MRIWRRARKTIFCLLGREQFETMEYFEDVEAHFYLQGFVNAQNCRIWKTGNPIAHAFHSAKEICGA